MGLGQWFLDYHDSGSESAITPSPLLDTTKGVCNALLRRHHLNTRYDQFNKLSCFG
jgi:hypothetical protein